MYNKPIKAAFLSKKKGILMSQKNREKFVSPSIYEMFKRIIYSLSPSYVIMAPFGNSDPFDEHSEPSALIMKMEFLVILILERMLLGLKFIYLMLMTFPIALFSLAFLSAE